ncbi:hypothetical protein AX15_004047 [Amanita polypyramis BW_CC]|nr:hypothetical protein AX15_004047 [Amanita polypyramis BW_CC]
MIDAEMGEALVAILDGTEFRDGEDLDVTIDNDSGPNKMGSLERNIKMLKVSWRLPSLTMIADYGDSSDAENAVRKLNNTIFSGRKIQAAPHVSSDSIFSSSLALSVKISGLPVNVSPAELQRHAGAISAYKNTSSVQFDSKNLERELRRHAQRIGAIETFEISPQNPSKVFAEVRIQFREREDAERAHRELNGRRLLPVYPLLRASLPKANQYTITVVASQYNAQKSRWDSISERDDNKAAFVQITKNGARVLISVVGDDKKVVGQLKVRVENLVAGETLDGSLWHRSFLDPAGRRFLGDVSSRTKAFVRSDWKTRSLKLYADERTKEAALRLIKAEVERLEASEWSTPITRRAVGFFMRKGLSMLKKELGDDAATLEVTPTPRLIIRGGEEAHRIVDRAIEESLKGFQSNSKDGEDTCPVCFDEVSSPVILGCNHVYCSECISHYLMSAPERKQFPLVCSGDEDRCKRPIPIPVVQRFLSKQQFDQLLEAAAAAYIEKQPNKFQYCTTADCKQVYCRDGRKRTLTCPSCFASVCTACNKDAHEGMTCEERDLLDNPEEQERRNEQWALAAGAKRCPSCRVLVQKTEGCNHMTCRCGSHWCWICRESFRDPYATYEHLRLRHGGIHADEVQQVQRADEQADYQYALRLQQQFNNERAGVQVNIGLPGNVQRIIQEVRREQREEPRRVYDDLIGQATRRIEERRVEERRAEERRRAEEIRTQEIRRIQEARRVQELRRAEEERTRERRGSWCVIM